MHSKKSKEYRDSKNQQSGLRHLKQVLNEVILKEKKHGLRKFRITFEKKYRLLVKYTENIKRLRETIKRIEEDLRNEKNLKQKLDESIEEKKKMYGHIEKEVQFLELELEKIKMKVTKSSIRLTQLEKKREELDRVLRVDLGYGTIGEKKIMNLHKQKEKLNLEYKLLNDENFLVENKLNHRRNEINRLTKKKVEKIQLEKFYQSEINNMNNQVEEFIKINGELEKRNRKIQKILKNDKIRILKEELENLENVELKKLHLEKKAKIEHLKKIEGSSITARETFETLKKELKLKVEENTRLEGRKNHYKEELDYFHKEEIFVKKNIKKLTKGEKKLKETLKRKEKKLKNSQLKKINVANEKKKENAERKEILRKYDIEKHHLEDIENQNEVVRQKVEKLKKGISGKEHMLTIKNGERRNINISINNYKKVSEKHFKNLVKLEKGYNLYEKEEQVAESKVKLSEEQLNLEKMKNVKLSKEIELELQKKKTLKNLIVQVKRDRDNIKNSFNEILKNIDHIKTKFTVHNTKIQVLKKDLKGLDDNLRKESLELCQSKEKLINLEEEKKSMSKIMKEKKKLLKKSQDDLTKLREIIAESELEKKKQIQELSTVINDKEIIGNQIIKRDEELSKLYDEIKLLDSITSKNKIILDEKNDEINLTNLQIKHVNESIISLQKRLRNNKEIDIKIGALQKKIQSRKFKIKALSQDLDKNLNVHPYRRIQGNDPELYSLLKKKQKIKKLIIKMNEEIFNKELEIKGKEKLYIELKKNFTKEPTKRDAQLDNLYKSILKKKKLEKINAEKNLFETKAVCKTLDHENEILKKDIENIKNDLFQRLL